MLSRAGELSVGKICRAGEASTMCVALTSGPATTGAGLSDEADDAPLCPSVQARVAGGEVLWPVLALLGDSCATD